MAKYILMGDSITDYLHYYSTKMKLKPIIGSEDDEVKFYGIENIGIGTYKEYVWPRVDRENVDFYFLLLGINNILRPDCDCDERESLNDVNKKLEEFITKILFESEARLVVQSIYPIDKETTNQKVKYINERLCEFCNKNEVEYLDMYSIFVDNYGVLKKEYSDDGIHPNELGYSVIAQAINDKIYLLKQTR